MDLEIHLGRFVHVAWRMLALRVDVVYWMLMKGVGMSALKDMRQAGRISKAKDAISEGQLGIIFF
jgi:hypothetical protein